MPKYMKSQIVCLSMLEEALMWIEQLQENIQREFSYIIFIITKKNMEFLFINGLKYFY